MRFTHIAALTLAFASLGMACRPSLAASDTDLKGAWRVTVTPTATNLCGPAIPVPPPFLELASYSAGGVFRETNTQLNFVSAGVSPAFPFSGSDGLGAWKETESGYSVNFTNLMYDAGGHYIGDADFLEDIDVSGDTFSGVFTVQFNFLGGGPAVCGGGTIKGQRIVVP